MKSFIKQQKSGITDNGVRYTIVWCKPIIINHSKYEDYEKRMKIWLSKHPIGKAAVDNMSLGGPNREISAYQMKLDMRED